MLTLPHSFSETGMIPGIVLQLSCAGVSICEPPVFAMSVFILMWLRIGLSIVPFSTSSHCVPCQQWVAWGRQLQPDLCLLWRLFAQYDCQAEIQDLRTYFSCLLWPQSVLCRYASLPVKSDMQTPFPHMASDLSPPS